MSEVIDLFNRYECKDFYIMSFIRDDLFGKNRLVVSGCNDLLKRDIYFTFEKNQNRHKVSFEIKQNESKLKKSFEVTSELFNDLLLELSGIDEMRARQISSISLGYGLKRSKISSKASI